MDSVISVIVPVYNARVYLQECVRSIMSQVYLNTEIILVDDGSDDGSDMICDELKRQDDRVRVIHQHNAGVVSARRAGVRHSKGEYITFVDADDTILPGMIKHLVEKIGSADIATCGIRCERKNGSLAMLHDIIEEGVYSAEGMNYVLENMIRFRMRNEEGILQFVFGKLFRRDVIKDVVENLDVRIRYAEDRELVYRCFLKADSVSITRECLYEYRYRTGSALHSPNHQVMHDLNYLYLSLSDIFQKHPLKKSLMRQLESVVSSRIYMLTSFMEFDPYCQSVRYIFPYYNLLNGKRVVLYGAGVVGCNYYHQIRLAKEFELVLWVDRDKQNEWVRSVNDICNISFDYIIIAIRDAELAENIRKDLVNIGVADARILWREPIVLAE